MSRRCHAMANQEYRRRDHISLYKDIATLSMLLERAKNVRSSAARGFGVVSEQQVWIVRSRRWNESSKLDAGTNPRSCPSFLLVHRRCGLPCHLAFWLADRRTPAVRPGQFPAIRNQEVGDDI